MKFQKRMSFYGYGIDIYLSIYLHVCIYLCICHLYLYSIFCSFLIETFMQIRATITSQTHAVLGKQIQGNLKKKPLPNIKKKINM